MKSNGSRQPNGKRICKKCRTPRDLSDFSLIISNRTQKQRIDRICDECRVNEERIKEEKSEIRRVKAMEYARLYRANPETNRTLLDKLKLSREEKPEKYAEHRKTYYLKHKERLQSEAKIKRFSARMEMLKKYGMVCSCCGESDIRFLTIDHISGGGRQDYKNNGTHIAFRLRKQGWPNGYQTLCYNCNCGRAKNRGICPHQEESLEVI